MAGRFYVLKYDALTLPMDKSRGFLVQRPAAIKEKELCCFGSILLKLLPMMSIKVCLDMHSIF